MVDTYDNKLTDITLCGCWAQLRRKFVEAIPSKKAKDTPLTSAENGRDYCNQLFFIEDELKNLSPEERFCKRLEMEKPVLEAFWCWLSGTERIKRFSSWKSSYLCTEPKNLHGELSS